MPCCMHGPPSTGNPGNLGGDTGIRRATRYRYNLAVVVRSGKGRHRKWLKCLLAMELGLEGR